MGPQFPLTTFKSIKEFAMGLSIEKKGEDKGNVL